MKVSIQFLVVVITIVLAGSTAWSADKPRFGGASKQQPAIKSKLPAIKPKCPPGWKVSKILPEGAFECLPDTSAVQCPPGYKKKWVGCGFGCYVDVPPPK